MAPIRVAIIGLSTNSMSFWASAIHLPYLLSPHGKNNYQISALLNTSTSAAAAAREHFGLPQSVKAYGDPQALAADPDVDLVVCSTFVTHHFDTVAPSLKAGKRVFVEWPLVTNLDEALELQSLAATPGVWERSIIGLQGRVSPPVEKLKDLLEEGKIGNVLSSDVKVCAKFLPLPSGIFPESLAFMADKRKGANSITIGYDHFIDSVHAVLGEWDASETRTQIQKPEVMILSAESGLPQRAVVNVVPDLVAVHGTVTGKEYLVNGATLVVSWQNGPSFQGAPASVWTINGEKGQIQLISPVTPILATHAYTEPVTIKMHDYTTDEVDEVTWNWED